MFYIPVAFYVTVSLVGKFVTLPLRFREDRARTRVRKRIFKTLTDESFRRLTNSGRRPDRISRDEFVIQMLLRLRKISLDDKDRCESLFNRLDKDRNGCIVAQDMAHSFGVRQQRALAVAAAKKRSGLNSGSPFKRSRAMFQNKDEDREDEYDNNSTIHRDEDEMIADDDQCSVISGLSMSGSTINLTPVSMPSNARPVSRKVGQKPLEVAVTTNNNKPTTPTSKTASLSKRKKNKSPLSRSIFRRVKKSKKKESSDDNGDGSVMVTSSKTKEEEKEENDDDGS